ncbi:MAG: UDP-2,3-diacylglucosamine diphosphatase [Richelia sp. RM2_1_2]|nr:UDP-2,3-diacylglucosamine diphosphatase [Richelia sp. RM2_1_2]
MKTHYRTIWLSDIHLGTWGCKSEFLHSFLKHHTCDKLYLVGDIIDGWRLKSKFCWPQEHSNILRRFLTLAKRGTKIVYIPGNHDEFLRPWIDDYQLQLGNLSIEREATHITADGKQFLIIHGDEFDGITRYHKWLAFLGDNAYVVLLKLNHVLNKFRQRFGAPYWSLSAYLKHKTKQAVSFICDFEVAIAHEARRRKFDGVICGHIHQPEIKTIQGIIYGNSGDWVESCSALVEHNDGRLEIIYWTKNEDTDSD